MVEIENIEPIEYKYEKLLKDLTAEIKKLNGNLPAVLCEIKHLREAIEKAEAKKITIAEAIEKAKPIAEAIEKEVAETVHYVKADGKQRIEKRG